RVLSTPKSRIPTPNSQFPTPKVLALGVGSWELGVGNWALRSVRLKGEATAKADAALAAGDARHLAERGAVRRAEAGVRVARARRGSSVCRPDPRKRSCPAY